MAKPPVELDELASLVQRLGVLLAAGVAPASAWIYLAESANGAEAGRILAVATAAGSGESITDAIVAASRAARQNGTAWRALAAAWLVATDAGAPLAGTLAELAASLRSLSQNRRDLATALAAPTATARMVLALPLVGVLFGLALGFDTVGTLFTTPLGLGCLGAGVGLIVLAWWWNRRLMRSARPTTIAPGIALDLMAIAVSGGASVARAKAAVAEASRVCGLTQPDSDAALDEVLALSKRAGVPAAALLRSEATEARRVARSIGERKAATLAVTLMLPLGLCVLPAFMLLGVAPLLISVISSTVRSF